MRALRPGTIQPCKICSAPAPVYGSVDFNKSCEETRGLTLPAAGIPVSYNRCPRCGFLFTAAFNEWGRADYQQAIYNDDYIVVDPDYRETRPAANAAMLAKTFESHKHELSLLDYGGGNGVLAGKLAEAGFPSPATYDPFTPAFATLPAKRFNIVTCFETLEHVPDPRRQIAAIAKCVDKSGMVVFSTLVQSAQFEKVGLAWWYVAPRNGHISIFSRQSLTQAWEQQGFKVRSFSDDLHIAYAKLPAFAKHLAGAST